MKSKTLSDLFGEDERSFVITPIGSARYALSGGFYLKKGREFSSFF
jgi:hypothetical protein